MAIIDGTFRADRHGASVVKTSPTVLNLEPPRKWTAAKKAAWRDLTRNLAGGLVQESDLAALEMAAVQLVTFRDADALVERDGLTVSVIVGWNKSTDEAITELVVNPMLKVRDKAAQEYRAWCVRFGFDPSSRVGLGLGAIKSRSMAADLEAKMPKPKNDGGP